LRRQETGVSKLETAVSFYSLTPQKSAKIEGFFGNEILNFLVSNIESERGSSTVAPVVLYKQ
jgi:hypothetical protein